MSLTKDWMVEDNLGKMPASRDRRALARAIKACVRRACFFSDSRKVGAAFERAKASMTPDEVTAIQSITSFPHAYSSQA